MTCRRNIKLLPPEIMSNLRSCVAISGVSQCVEELVLNAVDSCAKNIAVRLDLTFYKIQVIDNGFGITSDQLQLLGERYHTSKCHNVEDLRNLRFNGFRGEALASLRDICAVLEVTSRTQDNRTYFKAFHYGKATEVRLSVDERPSVGTTVTILDFMYNLPVRRKSICTFRDFEFTRRSLECIALVNPNISFTLRNNQTGETCLNTRRCNSMISSFRHLFGCDKTLKEIVYHSEEMKVQGFISTDGHSTNELQFLFVNCRLVLKTRLHELVRLVLAKYLNSKPRISAESVSADGTASPKKSSHPIFAFNLMCPFNEYDICFEPRKTLIEFEDWDKVTGTFMNVLRTFLLDEGYKFEDDEKYLKASSSIMQADSSNKDIDTSNSKNALFSLVIKRARPKRNKQRNSGNESKDRSPLDAKKTISQNFSADDNHHGCNSVTSYPTYPFPADRGNSENKSHIQNSHVPFTPDSFHSSNEEPRLKKVPFCKETSAKVGSQNRTMSTISSPIGLQFSSKQSSLSALRNRKRKESKLKQLRETFEFQRSAKTLRRTPTKSSEHHNENLKQRTHKSISERNSSHKFTSSNSYSFSSDIMDFSYLDTPPETDYFEERCTVPNVQKLSEDKWSILSQSQEIINAADTFLVPSTVVTQPRLENNLSVRSTGTSTKTANSSLENDSCQFLEARPSPACIRTHKCGDRLSQQSDVTNKLTQLLSVKNLRSGHGSTPSEVLSTCVSNQSASITNIIGQGSLNSLGNKEHIDSVSTSHSSGGAFPSPDNRLRTTLEPHTEQPDWVKWQDLDSGNILYINMTTGNSSYVPPPAANNQSKTRNVHSPRKDGHFFLSHNATPFLPRPERKINNSQDKILGTNKNMCDMLESWQNPVFKRTDFKEISSSSHTLRKPVIRVYSIVQNYKFFKSMFDRAKMLGQVDCKFIACLVPSTEEKKDCNLLVLFDQHAVHERIRLEQFIKDLYLLDGEVRKSTLDVPLRLEVPQEHVRLARVYSNQLEKLTGLGIIEEPSPCSVGLTLRCVPTCLIEREANELKNNRPSILPIFTKSLLEEQLQKLKETGNLGGPVPKTLHNVLSSRACKGAIKFGDSLSSDECLKLVKCLSSCQLPFQCAHGRPSVIPVLDVTHISRPLHWKVQRPRLFRLAVVKTKHTM